MTFATARRRCRWKEMKSAQMQMAFSLCVSKLSDTKSIFLILTSSKVMVMAGKLWHMRKSASLLTRNLPFWRLHGGEANRLRYLLPQIRPQLLVVIGGYKTLLYQRLHLQAMQLLQQLQHSLSTMKSPGICRQWVKMTRLRKR